MKDIQILLYHFHTNEPPRAVAPFTLPYTDITYLIDGELYYYFNGEPIVLHAGEAIVFPAGVKRERTASEKSATFASLNLVFPKEHAFSLSGVIKNAVNADGVYLLKLLYECYRTESPERAQKCNSLLTYLLSSLNESATGGGNAYVRAVKQMVLDKPYAHYTLAQIAEAVHLAPGYLCSLFKKHEGTHLFDYIAKKRIDFSKTMIISYDMPLSEVAERSGFSDYYAFSHAFKKYEGISAAQFKKQSRAAR
jgi:AraC-like DNA-binding protein